MTTLIYRNKETDSFIELFNQLANDYASKLTFVTREEYLAWVKQWKEDFKIVELNHKYHYYTWKANICVDPRKVEMYQNKLNKLGEVTTEHALALKEVEARFFSDTKLQPHFYRSQYVIWYMLILRKAGKIRAAKQRELQQQTIVAA